MNGSSPTPRVVRVSNFRDVKQVFALALFLTPVWLFCAYHEIPRMGKVHAEEWFVLATAGAFWILMPFVFLLPPLQLLIAGTWIADERGIEFIPLLPRLRRWRCMMWADVERVRWLFHSVSLQGGGERMFVVWKHLPSPQRETLKARVEAALAPAFDLSVPPARRVAEELSPRRVLKLAALPVGSVLAFVAVTLRYPQLAPAALVMAFGWIVALQVIAIISMARAQRRPENPMRWRLRRTVDAALAPAA